MKEIQNYYDDFSEEEWERLGRHKVEFDITKRYLLENINKPSKILDIGGGPGRYSIFLANQGHDVTLLDLSIENIKLAGMRAKEKGVNINKYIHGNALNLTEIISDSYDIILCMGPLYHLVEKDDRESVIGQCINILNNNGLLFASFISSYAPIIYYIRKCPEDIVGHKKQLLKYLEDGRNIVNEENNGGFTTSYFINPDEIEELMNKFNLTKKVITGVEGLIGQSEEKLNKLSEDAYKEWLDLIYKTSINPLTWGSCEHFLYIGKKIDNDKN